MVHTLAQPEVERKQPAASEVIIPLELAGKAYKQKVGTVNGVLLDFNKDLPPSFPVTKENVMQFCVFVDRTGKNTDVEMFAIDKNFRSLFTPIKQWSDEEGTVWRYLNIKGVGLSEFFNWLADGKSIKQGFIGGVTLGLSELGEAAADRDGTKLFEKLGVLTNKYVGDIGLKEIIMGDGKKVSIDELKIKTPILHLRAFSEIVRVENSTKEDVERVANLHGMTKEEYMNWWLKREANNFARMHRAGYMHGSASMGNLTLDGRIVDNDTYRKFGKGPREELSDLTYQIGAASSVGRLSDLTDTNFLGNIATFLRVYFDERGNIEREELVGIYKYYQKTLDSEDKNTSEFLKPLRTTVLNEIEAAFQKKFSEKLAV